MKQIGYIYKYRKVENKGILVYGKWKDNNSATNAPRPMLFSKSDCITKVDTGQLVYFELIEGELANIERASLSNFNKKVIKEIITPKKGDVYNWYSEKTTISFENLNDIVQPKKELENKHSNSNNSNNKDLEFDDIHGDIALDKVKDKNTNSVYDIKISDIFDDDQFEPVQLPETIEGIFDCFGKYQHDPFNCLFDESDDIYDEYGNNSISISILDMSLWIDEQTCKQICFGEKYEELKYLYDVFILKKWRNKNGFYYTPNKCISNSWKLLLAKFSNKELERIAVKFPLLQPVLPIQFCKEHLDYLSDEYGMPNLAICKLFIHNSIKKVSTASSYNSWSKKLLDYKSGKDNCQEQEEGVTMYELGNDYLDYISDLLEERYNSIVKKNIFKQYQIHTKSSNFKVKQLNDVVFSKDQIISLGLFMESLKSMPKILLDYELCNAFIEHYSCLTEEFQNHLKNYTRICINKSLIRIAKRRQLSPFILHNCIDIPFGRGGLSEWIEDSTKSEVIRIVNFKFSNLNDLEELKDAYKYGFISREQYYNKFQKLVSGYNLYQLTELLDDRILDNYGGVNKSTPLAIQWYVASRIIKYFDIKPQKPFKYVKLKYDVISDIRSLLNWFSKKNLDKRTLSKLEQRLFLVLDNKEKWSLFEEGFVSTPGEDNIRKRLNKAYENFSLDDGMFKKECFQTVMYKDLQNIDNPDLKLFIIDHLNSIYQQKAIMSFKKDNKR